MKRTAKITDILKPLAERPTQAYISDALQVADILEWILTQTDTSQTKASNASTAQTPQPSPPGRVGEGFPSPHPTSCPNQQPKTNNQNPITVRQTTFSISEEFLRRIYFIKKQFNSETAGSGTAVRFIVIIDRKALQKTVQLWRFISKVYDQVWISDNHSKILLIESPEVKAAMVTSQNLTRGNRAESSIISTDPHIYASLMKDFEDLRQNGSAPMHELMPIPGSAPTGSAVHPCTAPTEAPPEASPEAPLNSKLSTLNQTPADIERLAGCFVPISDIATVLGINPTELREKIADPDTEESLAYRRGKAKAKVTIKAREMELAAVGSPLGMQAVRENLLLMESDED